MFSFLSRLNIVGRMRAAEAELADTSLLLDYAERDRSTLLAEREGLILRTLIQGDLLKFSAAEYTRVRGALDEVRSVCAAVNSPNGTTRKLHRIAEAVLAVSPQEAVKLAKAKLTEQSPIPTAEQAVGA